MQNMMYIQEQSARPQTRMTSTRGPQNRSLSRATSRPHTVATTRTHKTHYYYGKPPPKEAHAAVLNLSRTQEIKAPIIERRLRSRESTKPEDAKQPHISVLQPYPMNYNTFLVQTLFKDMSKLYPNPDNLIKSGVEEGLEEDLGVPVVDSRLNCWKMTWNDTVYQSNAKFVASIYYSPLVIIKGLSKWYEWIMWWIMRKYFMFFCHGSDINYYDKLGISNFFNCFHCRSVKVF